MLIYTPPHNYPKISCGRVHVGRPKFKVRSSYRSPVANVECSLLRSTFDYTRRSIKMLEEAIHAFGYWNHQESAFRSISGCDFAGPLHFAAVAYSCMLKA